MTYPDLALLGRAGAGKDTVAAYLVERYGYVRLALADPIRELALAIDPIVRCESHDDMYGEHEYGRLSELVSTFGWDSAKRVHPEVRRLLQRMGVAQRERDPYYWVAILMKRFHDVPEDTPVVVTDVRFPEELEELTQYGPAVWVERDVPQLADPTENSVGPGDANITLRNTSDIPALHRMIDELLTGL